MRRSRIPTSVSRTLPAAIVALALLSPPGATVAAGAEKSLPVDKSDYTLFHPTPRAALRELSTDRPDKTESAYTVDAGHYQVELDLATFASDHERAPGADTRASTWAFMTVNFKVGLTNRVDLQTVVETYQRVTIDDRAGGSQTRQAGFGDISSRVKINLWGNDGGKTAMAIMPFVKFPTNQDDLGNDSVEAGVILPLAVELPAGFSLGLMAQLDWNRDEASAGRQLEFIHTATLSHDIAGRLGGYVELFGSIGAQSGAEWTGTLDLGLTYGLSGDIQLDAGVNIGVTDSADDFNPFVGLSLRF